MPKRDEPGERLMYLRKGLVKVIEAEEPEMIGYEEPHFPFHDGQPTAFKPQAAGLFSGGPGGVDQTYDSAEGRRGRFNVETVKFLQMVKGVLVCTAAEYGVALEGYHSASWRMTALKFGRAPRGASPDYMKKAMKAKAIALGYEGLSEDEAEALGIMLHAEGGKPAIERAQGDLLLMAKGKLL